MNIFMFLKNIITKKEIQIEETSKKRLENCFQKLTPTNDVELNGYKEALDFVFENNELKNIAISGAFSAGKSSVMESYKKVNPQKNFMQISLAYLKNNDIENDINNKKTNERIIEGKIINQLVHQMDYKKIPQTNFKIKHSESSKNIWEISIFIILEIIFFIYFIFFERWKYFVQTIDAPLKFVIQFTINSNVRFIIGTIFIFILLLFIKSIVKMQKQKNIFHKLSLNGNEIEIFEKDDESYFDKYLNEVLYIFENINIDAIIFEDLDRSEDNLIFQRLREINTLVNVRNSKTIRFFYLLKDDVFDSKERTKFFDFIIPVVPVIDASNSYDIFLKYLEYSDMVKYFDKKFLQDISLYIDDMRILKNIYNEFIIYNLRINNTEQDYNKLMAMIIYKNMFPSDFLDLQLGKGVVANLLKMKEEIIEKEKEIKENKIIEIDEKLQELDKEIIKSRKELDALVHIYGGSYKSTEEYKERIKIVETRNRNEENNLKDEKEKILEQLNKLESKKLYELINRENINEIFEKAIIKSKIHNEEYNIDLIKFLIRNGYINETYQDYMTYFYGGTLNNVDKIFLRSILDEKAKEYNYKLKNIEAVIERLNIFDFDKFEILNFDLLEFLLLKYEKYEAYILRIVKQLVDNKNYKFIGQYMEISNNFEKFIVKLNNYAPNLFENILIESQWTKKQIKAFSLNILYTSDNNLLSKINAKGLLADYISNQKDYLQIENPAIEKIIDALKELNIKLKRISLTLSNKELLKEVYNNNLYEINFSNVFKFLTIMHNFERKDIIHKNYSLISSINEEPIYKYIHEEINEYMDNVIFMHCRTRITDDETYSIKLLNNENIEQTIKEKYIMYMSYKLRELHKVNEALWNTLMYNKKVVFDTNNILVYYLYQGRENDNLINYINDFDFNISFKDKETKYLTDDNVISSFFSYIVKNNKIVNRQYRSMLKSLNRYYSDKLDISEIDVDKQKILIELKIIRMTEGQLEFVRENCSEIILYKFIKIFIDGYTNITNENNYIYNEISTILNMQVKDRYKFKLLSFVNEPLSIIDRKYSEKLKIRILENNFNEEDLEELLRQYKNLSIIMKNALEKVVIKYIDKIIENKFYLPFELIDNISVLDELSTDKKINLLASQVDYLLPEKCEKILLNLQRYDMKSLFHKGNPKILINNSNTLLLDGFKNKGWITKYIEDNKNSGYYRAYGRKIL